MPGQGNEVVKVFDWPAEEAAQQKIIGALDQVEAKIKAISGVSVLSKNVSGAQEFRQSSAEMQKAMQDLADMQKKLIDLENQLAAARYKTSQGSKAKTDEEIRSSVAARNEMKARTDAIKAEDDAYKQLALTYNKLAAEAKRLQAVALKTGLEEDKKAAEAAATAAKGLNDQLKLIDKTVGDNRRNVGNYADSFKEALNGLKGDFSSVIAQMAAFEQRGKSSANVVQMPKIGFDTSRWQGPSMSAGGGPVGIRPEDAAAYANLSRQAQVFNQTLNNLSKDFATSRGATRAYQEAVVTLGLELGQTDERFVKFDQKVGETFNEIGDLKAALKFNSQDGKLLLTLTSLAQGLAGAFGAAQAAVALMGDETEETQKQMAKFQQILVLINGLQAINNTIQEENGAIQGALAAKIALVNTARKIQALLAGQATAATAADTAANAANAVSQEGVATTAGEAAIALEGEAAAAEVATVATTTFSTALIASGIGVAIVAVGAAIVYLVSKIPAWIRGNQLTIEQQMKLADLAKEATAALKDQAAMVEELDGAMKRFYQNQLTLSQAAGKNVYEQFALRKKIAQEEKALAQETYDLYHQQGLSERQLAGEVDVLRMKREEAIKIAQKYANIANPTTDDIRQLNAAEKNMELYGKLYGVAKDKYDAIHEARVKLQQSNLTIDQIELEESKFMQEEMTQVTLQAIKIRANAIIRANEEILAEEASSQQERIAAQQAILRQQLVIIDAERRAKLAAPDNTPDKIRQIEREAGEARAKAAEESNQKIKKINDDYRKRERNAQAEILKLEAEEQARADAAIIADEKATYDQKLAALASQYNARKKSLAIDLGKDLETPGMTDEERKARLVKYESDLQELRIDFSNQHRQIVKENQDRILKSWEAYYASQRSIVSSAEAAELTALNRSIGDRLISVSNYERKRTEIQRKAAIERAQIEVQSAYASVNASAAGTAERYKAEERLASAAASLADLVAQGTIAKAKEKDKAIIDSATSAYDLAVGLIDAQHEREINRIQEEITANQAKYDKEKQSIANSTLNAQQRAAQIAIVDAKQQAKQHELEEQRRQEQQKQAVFDRDMAVLKITANTLIAASGAGWITPAAIAIEITGAAEIAALLAKPIPHFEKGTDSSPEGLAIVGEAGSEMRIDPSGHISMTPDKATLTYLERGTKIIPADEARQVMLNSIFGYGSRQPESTGQIEEKLDQLTSTIRKGNQDLINAFAKQKPAQTHIHIEESFMVHLKNSV